MLAEWFQYLTTPCPKHLRALGYPQEIIATQARYRRCKEAWRPHLENTKAAILESAEMARGSGRAVILGSGVLMDIPLAELCQRFDRVELLDIVHLPWVRRHALRYPNVRFHALDVTGICLRLFHQIERQRARQGEKERLPQLLPKPLTQDLGPIDFLASVNLLSQLPVMQHAYIENRTADYDEGELAVFSRALIENHLLWLKTSAEQVYLITDIERLIYDVEGREVEREDALFGAGVPTHDKEWIWNVVPPAEVRTDTQISNRVVGISIN